MPPAATAQKYGKPSKRSKAERLFAELPQSPVRRPPRAGAAAAAAATVHKDPVEDIAERLSAVAIHEAEEWAQQRPARPSRRGLRAKAAAAAAKGFREPSTDSSGRGEKESRAEPDKSAPEGPLAEDKTAPREEPRTAHVATDERPPQRPAAAAAARPFRAAPQGAGLRVLAWDDVCPPGDRILKIAEASYAEVYRVTNKRGTSIIKVMRLQSPIKPQTKQQIKAGLVDEEPRSEDDVNGELQISEWLADVPGFVVYKEKYVVQGRATKQLLETHQLFQRRMKRQDPGRAQFYPSPSRYLDGTRFLAVELGDAGTALEDWELTDERELWDVFFLEAIALARAEETAMFEHRDLHEGNICIRRVGPARPRDARSTVLFGFSGLDMTILDYGLSRAQDLSTDDARPVAFDLERDLSLFSSTHASQCNVYRRMRSFLLRGDRQCIPPEGHRTPYARGVDGPLSWEAYAPYSNVLWLAYLYDYLVGRFRGAKGALAEFRRETGELWAHLDPDADEGVASFGCAADIVCFAVEAGWISAEQLQGAAASMLEREDSIVVSRDDNEGRAEPATQLRPSPRKRGKGG